jgi:predicted short-subunit dehydrogenase-like oxidoreductase (DUF2520 family)
MRQVPVESATNNIKAISYGIIGDGKVATHFSRYLTLKNIPIKVWTRNSNRTVNAAMADCEFVLVLIKDSEIEKFITANPVLKKEKRLVHFSGVLATTLAHGIHPRFSLSDNYKEVEEYEKIPFISEKGGLDFKTIFPQLKNPSFSIDKELKPLYHSLCVMGGNFTTILWQKLFSDFEEKLGLPKEAAQPFLKSIFSNINTDLDHSLTGPLQRKDFLTIEKNINSLTEDPFIDVYKAFTNIYVPEFFSDEGMDA